MSASSEELKTQHAQARTDVIESEQEIQAIKAGIRRLTTATASDDEQNTLEVVLLKVDGLPETAQPKLTLQLSSPIEEATLSKLFDPLDTESDAASKGQSSARFQGVDLSVATLTVSASDANIPLGSSISYDVNVLCGADGTVDKAADLKEKYVADFPVAILDPQSAKELSEPAVDDEPKKPDDETAAAAESPNNDQEKPASDDSAKVEESSEAPADNAAEPSTSADQTEEAPKAAAPALVTPICTATFRVTFKPSSKDNKETLYELLNEASKKKAKAIESLRKLAVVLAQSSGGSSESSSQVTKPAVKPGFLTRGKNAPPKEKKSQLQQLQHRFFGPQSMLMKTAGVLVFARNYIIFFGATTFFHFRGHMLALPPPV